MKQPVPLRTVLTAGAAVIILPFARTDAASQTWNPGGAGGGAGNWGDPNWDAASAWVSGNTALFGGPAGTVTVGPQTAGAMTFNTGGYVLSSGTLTYGTASGASFVFTTPGAGTISSISDNVALTAPANQKITKTGAGTLVLSQTNTTATVSVPSPTWTITGGTFDAAAGFFDSIVQIGGAIPRLGTATTSPTPLIVLDAGTLRIAALFNGSSLGNSSRIIQVNAAGGAIVDATSGTGNNNNSLQALFIDNAGAGSSLYLSNLAGKNTNFQNVISGTGGITWNGAGTGTFSGTSTYAGPTFVNRGTLILSGSLGNSAVTVASGASLSLQNAKLQFNLANGADRMLIQPGGTVAVSGINDVRFATGGSLSPGTYPLISAVSGNLTGSFRFDGGSNLTIPALSQIRNVGGTFHRLTLQNSASAEQVAVTAAPANIVNIMPMGSSSTVGFNNQASNPGGGYRSQLYQSLVNDGRFTPNFVGSLTTTGAGSAPVGYNVLTGADQLRHSGISGVTSSEILRNISENPGTNGANGGLWLAPGNGVNPDYVTLSVGTNDYVYNNGETIGPVNRVDAIVSRILALRPAAHVILSTLFFRQDAGAIVDAQFNPRMPGVVFNHVLAGHHVSFVDSYNAITPNDSLALLAPSDYTHPLAAGYNILGTVWYNGLAFGSAYWMGGQDNKWSTVAAGATNFAQNYALTTPRNTALDPSADVHFNNNTAALTTALGQDLSVRGVNFAAGASGPVEIGGTNTLSLGVGGITAQAGTGAHTISTKVALGASQTWGNVSANTLTVSGAVSGNSALTVTGTYTIQLPVSNSASTTTQTYSGTGLTLLTGANTYTGGTTVTNGKLEIGNATGSGTGTGTVSVTTGGTLLNFGLIGGNVTVSSGGTVSGTGTFGGTVTVGSGGTFRATGPISGALTINSGGLLTISGGSANASGNVINNGTVRLAHGAVLAVGNGATLTNNGLLDVITGGVTAPAGLSNNGTILDSSVITVKSVNLNNGSVTVTINGYTGHTYQLQRSSSLANGSFINLGSFQNGATGGTLTFADANPPPAQGFYRVQVDP